MFTHFQNPTCAYNHPYNLHQKCIPLQSILTIANKILCDKAFHTAKNLRYDRYHCGLASMVCDFLGKITSGGTVKNDNIS